MDQMPHMDTEQEVRDHRGMTEAQRPARQRGKRRRRWLIAGIAGLVAAGVVAQGIIARRNNVSKLTVLAKQRALPKGALISPEPGPKTRELTLPGNVDARHEANLYA
jgi:membrane fusion protein, multidrug efflux system